MSSNTPHYRVTTYTCSNNNNNDGDTCSIMYIIVLDLLDLGPSASQYYIIVLLLFKILLLLLLLVYVLIIKIILKLISREGFPHLETPNSKKTSIISSTLTPRGSRPPETSNSTSVNHTISCY